MQTVDVIRVVDPEGRLNDGKLLDKFDTGGSAGPEICSRGDGKLLRQAGKLRGLRELSLQIAEAGRIEPQGVLAENAGRAAVKEERRLHRANDGDAVLKVSIALSVAAREGNGVAHQRHADGPRGRLTESIQASCARVSELLDRGRRNESDRRDRANIKTADVGLSAHVEAAVRGRFPAAVTGDERTRSVKSQNVAVFVHRMEVLPIENVADALDVAAETRKPERIEIAFTAGGIHRIVDGVIGNCRRDGAGDNSIERAGTGNAAELQLGEQELGSVVEGSDVGAGQAVIERYTGEGEFSNRIAGKDREAGTVLVVILNKLRVDADGLSGEERSLPSLVKLVAAGKDRETRGDGPVKKIGLGESEKEAARKVTELCRKGQSFAQTQEVVGLIGEADKAAGQTADTALQADRLFALLLELEVDIDGTVFVVAFDLRGLVRFDPVEVVELV